ncbi:LysR family transcriptional regulator [Paracoccus methylarcula]|uniref:LysR family transcriptional regulator n=1 Tax=Paracoccus methylarcula TaxID=72022 RepID=A0A3R7Q2B2_9RHOB|nr:LysR family transcriptional regulator [Paracoccus methylarcula]RNF34278.1 LysR family transcriptional regulator [Paracoccus methylarcula]
MELRQLRNFIRICQMRSITAAAERLNIAQPALSRQVQALEDEFGVALLRRHGRGVEPTEQGELLLTRAEQLLADADSILRDVPGNEDELRGTLTLGLPPSVAELLAEPLIAHFNARYPQVRLRIVSGFTGHVRDWLQRGTIDLGITYETGPSSDHHARALVYEQLYLVCPASGRTGSQPIGFAEAFEQPLILPSPAHGLRRLIEAAAAGQGITPEVVLEVDIVQVMLNFVQQGVGNTILSRISVRDMLANGELAARPIISPELGRTVVLWTPGLTGNDRLVRRFAEMLVEQARILVESGTWEARWL